jgi:excisionase family DNA binding protein
MSSTIRRSPSHLSPPGAVVYLAERYQLEVSDEYLRRRAGDGTIAHTRLSRNKLLFAKADLDAWVKRSHVAES